MEKSTVVIFERDETKDQEKDGIKYYGYKVMWEDKKAVGVGLEKLCSAGLRTVVGKKSVDHLRVQLKTCWIDGPEVPRPELPEGERARRLYVQAEGENARIYFHNGNPTDIVFGKADDPRALDLFRVNELEEGKQLWFDLRSRSLA